MTIIKPQTLASDEAQTLAILINIIKDEGNPLLVNFPTVGYPVLIGSRAAKWHIPSFREPNDWDFIATVTQTVLFINEIMIKELKLIHYSGIGLKLIGECIESSTNKNSINFEVELVSDKVDFRKMRLKDDHEDNEKNNMEIDDKDNVDKKAKDDTGVDNKDEIVKFEFEKFDDDQERERSKTSAQMIFELCHDVKDRLMFPLSKFPFIVAPLEVLEVLKASHIYWSAGFHKHITDLHTLRVILGYNNQVPTTQPLCSPPRNERNNFILKTRIKETEMIRGVPGAHINLKKTNEEFLDREDDLFVQRRVPHDELHERVKYGDRPIYETLKKDKSKAWIEKSLFQQIDYQTQLNCVREEAMVIALERYLIPMVSKNQETSYHSALVRICTSLTKGWFRQFTIDNYPRLLNLDKDLLSIAANIIENHPLPQKKREVPSTLLHKWVLDPDTRAIFEVIHSHTKIITYFEDLGSPYSEKEYFYFNSTRTGLKITSPVNENVSIAAVITTVCTIDQEDCKPGADWWASIAIVPSEDLEEARNNINSDECDSDEYSSRYYDPLHLHPFTYSDDDSSVKRLNLTSKHIFTLIVSAKTSGGSWDVAEDIWYSPDIFARSADNIANKLQIPGFTGDLLFKYVLAYLQPTLENSGSTPLKHQIDELKAGGVIPVEPRQHLWYDAWNYALKNRKRKSKK